MASNALSAKQAVADFLREEAPLEFERLRSIGRLAPTRPDLKCDCPDLSLWVREALDLAI